MDSSRSVQILGGGPAGSAAAIAALSETHSVHIFEKSAFPRHKVCGEFLSGEIVPLLESFGLWQDFVLLGPALITKMILHFGTRVSQCQLPEKAYGLSRYEFDRLLFDKAISRGAITSRQRLTPEGFAAESASKKSGKVLAIGRRAVASPGNRLFGFKAHFKGPVNDAVEMFFFRRCYIGVSAIENGMTNICGIAPEGVLREYEFNMDDLLTAWPPLASRTRPLFRVSRWLSVGPLVFCGLWDRSPWRNVYLAGDSLGFIDPFTGLGLVTAVGTGRMAGLAAGRGSPVNEHLSRCRRRVRQPMYLARILRGFLDAGLAEMLGPLIPGRHLFRLTRPSILYS